jgi:hypothetical protein
VYGFKFTEKLMVPMTIHCVSRLGPEAERLASAVFMSLLVDEPVLKRRGVHSLTNPTISSEGIFVVGADTELVSVPVNFQMEYCITWARLLDGGPLTPLLIVEPDTGVP